MSKNNNDYLTDWSEAIQSVKMKENIYYLKEDTEKSNPFKVKEVTTYFDTGVEYVSFYTIRTDNPKSYVLEKDEFAKKFICVVE